ncbi:phage regulatory CII family protein [Enterovibrio norvegicus]|uniref:phage regulatory CII family protein n=1 Tax=Enterovibrio norvegicus TaxID=188144 RepID=UPI000C82C647|nr:phage regulatory CII family protein [Enterovibrio norvegicus]PMN68389.1 hypothetical protein BCT27_23595 [Enterovibrio norvegicus]
MTKNSSMCELRERKQKIWDDACCAFANAKDMTAVANTVGMTPQMFRNKMNPAQPHQLTVRELINITNETGNELLVSGLLSACDMVGAKVSDHREGNTLAVHALLASQNAGELSTAALKHGNANHLPRTERETLRETAQRGVRNLVLLINELENRTASAAPFLSMSMEAIGNGLPMPGLS